MITPLLALALLAGAADPPADRIDARDGGRSITVAGRFAKDRGSPAIAADFDRLPPAEASGQ